MVNLSTRPARKLIVLALASLFLCGGAATVCAKSKKDKPFPQVTLFKDKDLKAAGLKAIWKLPIPNQTFLHIRKVGRHLLTDTLSSKLFAIDDHQGIVRWAIDTPGAIIKPPVLANGVLYFITGPLIFGVGEEYGDKQWVRKFKRAAIAPPCIHEGAIFMPAADNRIYVFDAIERKYLTRMRFATAQPRTRVYCYGPFIVFGSQDNRIIAYDFPARTLAWSKQLPSPACAGLSQRIAKHHYPPRIP